MMDRGLLVKDRPMKSYSVLLAQDPNFYDTETDAQWLELAGHRVSVVCLNDWFKSYRDYLLHPEKEKEILSPHEEVLDHIADRAKFKKSDILLVEGSYAHQFQMRQSMKARGIDDIVLVSIPSWSEDKDLKRSGSDFSYDGNDSFFVLDAICKEPVRLIRNMQYNPERYIPCGETLMLLD